MQKGQEARLDAYRRIRTWLDSKSDVLGLVNKSTSRTDLDAAVVKLETDASAQGDATAEMTSRTKMKATSREGLRLDHMQPIAAIAKKKLGSTPVIQDLQLPKKNTSDAGLINDGGTMALAAAKYTQVFLDQQLPADFIAQLNTSVADLKAAVAAREIAQLQLNERTKALKDQFAVTHTDVKVLNALVVKQLKGKTDLLTAWKNAKRIKAKPGVPAGSTPPATTPAAPTPPATTPPTTTPAPSPTPTPAPTPAPMPAPSPAAASATSTPEVPKAA